MSSPQLAGLLSVSVMVPPGATVGFSVGVTGSVTGGLVGVGVSPPPTYLPMSYLEPIPARNFWISRTSAVSSLPLEFTSPAANAVPPRTSMEARCFWISRTSASLTWPSPFTSPSIYFVPGSGLVGIVSVGIIGSVSVGFSEGFVGSDGSTGVSFVL